MKVTVKTTGFNALEAALAKIEKQSTQKAILRRSLIKAAEPMAAKADSLAPDDASDGRDRIRIGVSTTLSRRQKKLHKKAFRNDKAAVEVFVGAAPHPVAVYQEFGVSPHVAGGEFAGARHPGHRPQPFMRPAWDAEAKPTLERLKTILASEIQKTAARAAKKAAKGK